MAHDEQQLDDINQDPQHWLNQCVSVLRVIDLRDYTASELAPLAIVLQALCPVSSETGRLDSGVQSGRHLRVVR